jgi:hypothetical protein
MSVACLSRVSVAQLQEMNRYEEMCAVDNFCQSGTQKFVCTVCSEKDIKCVQCVQCVQCVRADVKGGAVIGQGEVAMQMSYMSSRARPIIGNICIIGKYRYRYRYIGSDITNIGIGIIGIGSC